MQTIEEIQNLELDNLRLNIDKERMNEVFKRLEINSLVK